MPIYPYNCPEHGAFELLRGMDYGDNPTYCPICSQVSSRLITLPVVRIINKPRLQFGSGSQGKIISHKDTGGLDIFIPSMGAMEQEEVDYIAEGAKEKEIARVKIAQRHGPRNENQARIQAYTDLAMSTPKGSRAKVLREAMKNSGDKLIKTKGV